MKKAVLILTVLGFAAMGSADAVMVTYTVDGVGATSYPSTIPVPVDAPWGPSGYPGDTVALGSYTGAFDLVEGTTIQDINSLLWAIDYTYGGSPEPWPDLTLNFSLARNITIYGTQGTVLGELTQPGSLLVNYYNDYLSIDAGSTLSLLVDGFQVDITPLALPAVGGSDFDGGNPWTQPDRLMQAEFVVTAVPEPITMVMLGCMGVGMAGARKLRRKNKA